MIDVNLLKSITKNKLLIKSIPVENIRDELNEIIMSDVPSRVLILMQKLQILDYILPELSRCVGIKQDKRYHAHNVFKHCVYACDEADKDLVLRLACLLHDVGKSFKGVRRVSELGKVSFHKHETMGAEAVENRLTQLKYSNDTVKKVTSLIKFHMYHYSSDTYQCTSKSCNWKIPTSQSEEITICPECKSKVVYTKGWTDGSVINFIRNVGISEDDLKDLNEFPLFKLRAAERKSNPIKRGPIAQKQIDFQNRIVEVYNKYKIMTVNDLDISGDIIMKIYNLSPSQKIGMIKRYLLERLENEVENGGDMHELNKQSVLLKWVFDFIVEEDNKDVV